MSHIGLTTDLWRPRKGELVGSNSRFTNAIHALCWIELAARRGRSPLTSAEIATSLSSNPVQIRRALAPLKEVGLVAVVGSGPGAGWVLARAAKDIDLATVLRAVDGGEPIFGLHPHEPNQECTVGANIAPVLTDVYAAAQDAIEVELARSTIEDVLTTVLRADAASATGSAP